MENENIIKKKTRNKDLLYSLVLNMLAWATTWFAGDISSIFDPLKNFSSIFKPYLNFLYFLSRFGFQADPIYFLFTYAIPVFFSVLAIYLSVRYLIKTPIEEGKRKLFGFITNDSRCFKPLILITTSILYILLLWVIFARIHLFQPSIFE